MQAQSLPKLSPLPAYASGDRPYFTVLREFDGELLEFCDFDFPAADEKAEGTIRKAMASEGTAIVPRNMAAVDVLAEVLA